MTAPVQLLRSATKPIVSDIVGVLVPPPTPPREKLEMDFYHQTAIMVSREHLTFKQVAPEFGADQMNRCTSSMFTEYYGQST